MKLLAISALALISLFLLVCAQLCAKIYCGIQGTEKACSCQGGSRLLVGAGAASEE